MRPALVLSSLTLALGLGLFGAACGDECSRAGDCDPDEVCRLGTCTRAASDYLACASDEDCGNDGVLVCRSGRCSFQLDRLMPDTGTSTSGDAGP